MIEYTRAIEEPQAYLHLDRAQNVFYCGLLFALALFALIWFVNGHHSIVRNLLSSSIFLQDVATCLINDDCSLGSMLLRLGAAIKYVVFHRHGLFFFFCRSLKVFKLIVAETNQPEQTDPPSNCPPTLPAISQQYRLRRPRSEARGGKGRGKREEKEE